MTSATMEARHLREIALDGGPACRHEGFHSPTSRYDRRAGVLQFLLVCDGCGAVVEEVTRVGYRPRFAACNGALA